MKKFVLHTHSVYANLCCCSNELEEIARKAFDGADYSWGWVEYTDPGANLTFAIRDEIKKVKEKTGKEPAIILMQNHGIIAHADTAQEALSVHSDANERLANAFGIRGDSFPKVSIKDGKADTPYLKDALKSGAFDYKTLIESPLYPDQMIFLIGTLFENKADLEDGECSVNFADGSVIFNMGDKKALTITETLTAVTFIMNTIKAKGYSLSTMGEAAKHFIANRESEKYRKSLAGGNKK